jgi:hypothetical protein
MVKAGGIMNITDINIPILPLDKQMNLDIQYAECRVHACLETQNWELAEVWSQTLQLLRAYHSRGLNPAA